MEKLIYLIDDFNMTIERILQDRDLEHCGLTKENVGKTLISFGGDEIASSVFLKKYALRNEENIILEFTLEEAKNRWANAISKAEALFGSKESEEMLFSYFRELYDYFFPAGRQMLALGNDYLNKATYTNCYVTKIEDDSIDGIYDAAKNCARTYSYGGGIGLCIGELRPTDSKVSNSAKFSTGAVSFMELYSHTTDLIGQQGRRGALMITIPVNHPDIFNFIEIKHNNIEKVKHANISIKLTNEFMEAVEGDREFTLTFSTKHEQISKKVRAKDLWNKIVMSARDSAEPGLMFWDKMIEMSPSDSYPRLKVHATNPCVTGDTLIATPNGWRRVDEIIIGDFISTVNGYGQVETIETHENMPVYELELNDGTTVKVTLAHQFHVSKRDKETGKYSRQYIPTRLDSIEIGDYVRISGFDCWDLEKYDENQSRIKDFENGLMTGILLGDGCYSPKTAARNVAKIASSVEDVEWNKKIINLFSARGINLRCDRATDGSKSCSYISGDGKLLKLIEELRLPNLYSFQKELPKDCFIRNSREFNRGVLDGLFSTDGNVNLSGDAPQIRLKSTSKSMLVQVKQLLLSFNIYSTLSNCGKTKKILGRSVNSKTRYEIVIGGQSVKTFIKKIGISNLAKNKKCQELLISWSLTGNTWRSKVKSIKFIGNEKVYDLYEPTTDTWITNGVVSRGCGEQILEPGGACVLGSLLLHKFVINPFTKEAYFDYDKFKDMVRRGVRHLDNVVELNFGRHPLQEQEEAAKLGRRIGLGITGLADMFAALGVKYDSDEALKVANFIMEIKKITEYDASIDLAEERGSFPLYNSNIHFSRGFGFTLPNDLILKAKEKGLRNVAISTIAPNGSLSIIAQCSSGAEPIYDLHYTRTVMLGKDEKKKFSVFHQGVVRFFETTGSQDLPDYWITAHEINDVNRVKLQGVLQKHIDASISSTINLPKDTTAETVGRIYFNAWKEGLKGITVYREGSREGILTSDNFVDLGGKTIDMNTTINCVKAEGGDKFYIMISYENKDISKPFQVFVMNYKKTDTDAFVKISNALIKMLKEKGESEERINKYINRSNNSLVKMTRFLSLSMKTGNLGNALSILEEHAFVGTLALKLYEILSKSVDVKKSFCPNCGSSNLKTEETCISCLDCNWSRCH